MARSAFHFTVIDLDAIVKAIRGVRWAKILIFVGKSGIGHGEGMVVGKIGTDVFDGDTMRYSPVMAFAATHQVVGAVEPQVQGGILTACPAIRFEHRHVQSHSAIVAGQAQQADRAGRANLVVQGAAVIEVISTLCRNEAVPSRNSPLGAAIGLVAIRGEVAVNAGRAVVGEGHSRHGHHADALV